MSLPDLLQHFRTSIAADLNHVPLLHPTPHQRRAIYRLIGPWDDPLSRRVRAWLAISAAQRALPIFQTMFPDDDLPAQLINAAVRVLQGTMEAALLRELAERAYNAAGHCWGYAEDELPDYADYAGQAAYHALSGATHGLSFLQDLDTGFGTMTPSSMHMITGGEWTNRRLLDFPNAGDSALYAAVALATNPETNDWEREPWTAFWMWWLNEGLTAAWERGLAG
jgi:hypothetical protein